MTVLTEHKIVCPMCYETSKITITDNPRVPAPGNKWLCSSCRDLSVFDDSLDLRMATDAERAQALGDMALPR